MNLFRRSRLTLLSPLWAGALALSLGLGCSSVPPAKPVDMVTVTDVAGEGPAPDAPDAGPDAVGDMVTPPDAPPPDLSTLTQLDCEVAIVGGGAGGMHTALRLGPKMGKSVCLFEKEAGLGGRIHDVTLNDGDDGPWIGTGARRVMETQDVLFALADELGLTLETPPNTQDLINARGLFSFSKDDLWTRGYPGLTIPPEPDTDEETTLYNTLRFGPLRKTVTDYPDFPAYIKAATSLEGFNFIHDMSRFRADFEYPLDARGYLDYLDEEWDVCCQPSYPVGGMSSFIRGMESKATKDGVRIFKGEPVLSIDRATGGGYTLVTSKSRVSATRVVIAAPPLGLDQITGDVADDIKSQQQYKEIIGVKVVTITQWWPTDWWTQIENPNVAEDAQVWRAWTTDHCLNFIEIPLNPDAVAQKVTRSVYDDDIRCVTFWEGLAQGPRAALEAEIKSGLELLFNNNGIAVPGSVTIPDPLKTHVQIWPAAWYWLRAGATQTNSELTEWAVEPLAGEDVGLVGEAYNVQRSGWSDGAYKSSIKLLQEKYGIAPQPLPNPHRVPRRGPRHDGR